MVRAALVGSVRRRLLRGSGSGSLRVALWLIGVFGIITIVVVVVLACAGWFTSRPRVRREHASTPNDRRLIARRSASRRGPDGGRSISRRSASRRCWSRETSRRTGASSRRTRWFPTGARAPSSRCRPATRRRCPRFAAGTAATFFTSKTRSRGPNSFVRTAGPRTTSSSHKPTSATKHRLPGAARA